MPAAIIEKPSQTAKKPKLTFQLTLISPTQPPPPKKLCSQWPNSPVRPLQYPGGYQQHDS
ncbi:hypothetical protein PGT21_012575 [Puccinia graminis f. sp. tritici]|uniref:Uncharacterized protein n=1 Tax=Puccinia graminis f. sp. tritici TaxID=56615 RepID=A0A5B0RV24_PUCGR|nr:hypothetical protein PGT21_012575 [Puccinia graminis f. sp. tritici]KAA1129248.1 hypothetical protein PGTUg99_019825 [Puccinia graminis f. sp. tritici]